MSSLCDVWWVLHLLYRPSNFAPDSYTLHYYICTVLLGHLCIVLRCHVPFPLADLFCQWSGLWGKCICTWTAKLLPPIAPSCRPWYCSISALWARICTTYFTRTTAHSKGSLCFKFCNILWYSEWRSTLQRLNQSLKLRSSVELSREHLIMMASWWCWTTVCKRSSKASTCWEGCLLAC